LAQKKGPLKEKFKRTMASANCHPAHSQQQRKQLIYKEIFQFDEARLSALAARNCKFNGEMKRGQETF
jgi:D-alanine-D-alanine ligase-like ATP-grasp enzyme